MIIPPVTDFCLSGTVVVMNDFRCARELNMTSDFMFLDGIVWGTMNQRRTAQHAVCVLEPRASCKHYSLPRRGRTLFPSRTTHNKRS
jgi:hypothetical protein